MQVSIDMLHVGDIVKPETPGGVIICWPGKQLNGLYITALMRPDGLQHKWAGLTIHENESLRRLSKYKGLIIFINKVPMPGDYVKISHVMDTYAVGEVVPGDFVALPPHYFDRFKKVDDDEEHCALV